MISTEIPTAKQISKKIKKKTFFSVCVHISKAKESNRLMGVAARKKLLSKNNKPTSPMLWKKTAMAVAISNFVNLFNKSNFFY